VKPASIPDREASINGREGLIAGGQPPATVIRFTADDLARVRFGAAPSPLCEATMGFAEFRYQSRQPVPSSWASRARRVFPAAALPLCDLIPVPGLWPEFLDPAAPDLDEALEIVSATSRSSLRDQLTAWWQRPGHPPTWLKALAGGDPDALRAVVEALRAFYLACVAPVWPQITASFRSDVAERSTVLAHGGLGELFGTLHQDLTLRDGALERSGRTLARAGRPGQYQLEGQGMQIVPSVLWTGPPLFAINPPGAHATMMIYPARRGVRAQRPDLNGALGRTRARALRALDDPCSTSELAARLGISVSSASEYATALRSAELIRTERHGRNVRHSLTPLGRSLLGGAAGK
jgi:DNA-binding transcriptional ArsR family regulator